MARLTEAEARALRLLRADRVGDILNAQADIDAIDKELALAAAFGATVPVAIILWW